jgi:RNA polymerase sigma-70 factor (ECF subfamily)
MQERTTTLLLEALHDPANEPVWLEFDARYRPILTGFARQLGLQPDDAVEAAQETLTQFVRDYRAGKYDRGKGRLSSWIVAIARNRVLDLLRARAKRREWRGDSAFAALPDEQQLSGIWDAEQERLIFAQAIAELREKTRTAPATLRAFELFALEGLPADAVGRECGLSSAEVYRVKNRVTKRLREIVTRLNAMYAEDD